MGREVGGDDKRISFDSNAGNAHNACIDNTHGVPAMAVITIRNVDDEIKRLLRIRAAQHGVSMEEEARRILREALSPPVSPAPMGQRLRERFAEVACEEFSLPGRHVPLTPPSFQVGS